MKYIITRIVKRPHKNLTKGLQESSKAKEPANIAAVIKATKKANIKTGNIKVLNSIAKS